jgi:hypothetical protein
MAAEEQMCEPMDMDDDRVSEEDVSEYEDYKSLTSQIEDLCKSSDLLTHRLDTIQRLLDQQSFNLETQKIKVGPFAKAKNVRKLLDALQLNDEDLCVGDFLRALNCYLIHNDLVDLNDLQIKMTPLLSSAFQKAPGLKKIPYPLLLTALPKMFV